MTTVHDHYANHLAAIYLWMAGGLDAAVRTGAQDLAEFIPGHGLAVDLGAGFGMHSIPLARAGYQVLAIDTSAALLQTLSVAAAGLPIQAVERDLLQFRDVLPGPASLVVCMGDTLTHLQDFAQVEALCEDIKRSLAPGGCFISVFRDYSAPARGDERFVAVRDDPDRLLTCFVEEEQTHMKIHDIVHERSGTGWSMKVSSYRKIRLRPAELEATLRSLGLSVRRGPGPRGMVRVQASSPS
jgi:SAM-dependent methyltransferase